MQKNIFIVGCPRSGTTFTQSFFAAHPLVYATPETQFFIELIGYQQLQQRLRPHSFIVRSKSALSNFRSHLGLAQHGGADVRREVRFFLRGMQRQDLFERFPRYDPRIRALSGAFLEIIEHLAEDEGKFIWVEKSPNHLFSIESIEDLVPGSMFIHVLRDGRDTVASLKDIAIRYPDSFWRMFADVDRCIQRWNICVETSMRYLGRSNHYLLRYEDLLKDPEAKLRDMCSFLGTQ